MKYKLPFILLLISHFTTLCAAQEARGVIVPKTNKTDSTTGNTYAIILGISDYPYLKPLHFADKDAELFRDFLLSPAGGKVDPGNLYVMLNEQATSANFWIKGFQWLRNKKLQKGDRLYLYFAGHGDAIDKDQYFFLPYDCSPAGDKNNYLATSTIQVYNVKVNIEKFSNIGVDVILIMDACRSNELPGGEEGQKILGEAIAEKRSGETMMLAAASGQESLEDRSIGNGHGLFTWYLIDGLSGNADADVDNGNQNGKIELDEIESWVKRNVKKVALQKFNHVQVPYFCCSGISKTIAKVDSSFFKQWITATKVNADAGQNLMAINKSVTSRAATGTAEDTSLIKLYNQFNRSVKENRLNGNFAAEYWYNKMAVQFPKHRYTEEAKYTLTTELINFAQEKINLYLTGNDYKFQKATDSSNKNFLFEQRLKAIAKVPFYKVASMLEKGINLSKEFDTSIERKYLAKLYFLKARGAFEEDESTLTPRIEPNNDIKRALGYAYAALRIDTNAAYIYHLLAKFQYCKNWVIEWDNLGSMTHSYVNEKASDSISYYEKNAIRLAPSWPYIYYYWGDFYINKEFFNRQNLVVTKKQLDSSALLLKKCLELNPEYAPAYLGLANISNREDNFSAAVDYIKKGRQVDMENRLLKSALFEYYIKLNPDSGFYYYQLFGGNKTGIFYSAFRNLSSHFIDADNKALSIFICKEELSSPDASVSSCEQSPAYALSKNKLEIADTLIKMISRTSDTWVKWRMYVSLVNAYEQRNEYAKVAEYKLKEMRYDSLNKMVRSGDSCYVEKNYDKAIYFYLKVIQTDSAIRPGAYFSMADCYYKKKDFETSVRYYLKSIQYDEANSYYNIACNYSLIKKENETLIYLEKSIKAGFNDYAYIQVDSDLEFIRTTVKFKALMQQYFPGK